MSEKASHMPPVNADAAFNPDIRQEEIRNFDYMQDFSLETAAPDVASAQEKMQDDKDLEHYYASRPFPDTLGRPRSPQGASINTETYFDSQRSADKLEASDQSYESRYDDKSVDDLHKALWQAEIQGDKTTVDDLSEVVQKRLAEENSAAELAGKAADSEYYGSPITGGVVSAALEAKITQFHNGNLRNKGESYQVRNARSLKVENEDGKVNLDLTQQEQVDRTPMQDRALATDKYRRRLEKIKQARLNGLREADEKSKQASSKNEHNEDSPSEIAVQYAPRKDGKVQLGTQLTEKHKGSWIDSEYNAARNQSRKVIVRAGEIDYYLRDNQLHLIEGSDIDGDLSIRTLSLQKPQKITIGEQWELPDGTLTDPVEEIEIAESVVDAEQVPENLKDGGFDPFEDLDGLLEDEHDRRKASREREQNKSGLRRRWDQLRAWTMTAPARLGEALSRDNEHSTRNRRALGAVALLGVGLIGYKFGLLSGGEHHSGGQEMLSSPKGPNLHLGELPAPSGNGAHHAAEHAHHVGSNHHGSEATSSKTVSLKPGDSEWHEQYVHDAQVHPNWSAHHTEVVTNRQAQEWLHQMHMNEEEAEKMAVGTKVTVK